MKKYFSKHFWFSLTNSKRRFYLFLVSIIGLSSSLFLTIPAWTSERSYPLTPILSNLTLQTFVQAGLFYSALVFLLASIVTRKYRRSLVTFALLGILTLVLLDITRLQPWALHYGAILLLFSWFIDFRKITILHTLDAARIIVGGIYFWSGIQKLNFYFFSQVFPWFTQNLWEPFGDYGLKVIIFLGLLTPFIEAAFAIGFFSKKFRAVSILGSTIMITLVLASIGPTGHGWNSSVWPWNVGIFSMVIVLFLGTHFSFKEFLKRQRKNLAGLLAFCIFWLMPAGNLFGLTDHYLSWSLYTGKVPEATLYGDQLFLESLSGKTTGGKLLFTHWTMTDLNMVPYPEVRVFKSVFTEICTHNPNQPLKLEISDKEPGLIAKEKILTFECN